MFGYVALHRLTSSTGAYGRLSFTLDPVANRLTRTAGGTTQDLMIIGWTKPHPPLNLFFEVSKNGEPIVPLLIQRISKINDMHSLRPIAMCLYEVNLRYYEWTSHQEYAEMFQEVLSEKIDLVQVEFIKILETGKLHPNFTGR